jgi:hypothetical protein
MLLSADERNRLVKIQSHFISSNGSRGKYEEADTERSAAPFLV